MNHRRPSILHILLLAITAIACRFSTPSPELPPDTAIPQIGETATGAPEAPEAGPLAYSTGPNEYTIDVDGSPREFLVYVPASYQPGTPTPVVFMYHGSNQGGPIMFQNTSWSDHADENGFLVVYPTSWKYRLLEDNRLHRKWNTLRMAQQVVDPAELRDDVRFTRVMVDLMKTTFNVDEDRIFASGFSNGGGFVMTRLMVEMRDVFASFSASGTSLWEKPETSLEGPPPDLYVVLGTRDDKVSEGRGIPVPFPISADDIASHPEFSAMLDSITFMLSLSDSSTVVEEPPYTTFTFDQSLVGADNVYHFRMVEGMFHVYNNGEKIPQGFDAAELFWEFFMENPRE